MQRQHEYNSEDNCRKGPGSRRRKHSINADSKFLCSQNLLIHAEKESEPIFSQLGLHRESEPRNFILLRLNPSAFFFNDKTTPAIEMNNSNSQAAFTWFD
jgi:hypothetical protein